MDAGINIINRRFECFAAVLNLEDDVAAFTIMVANDPRTLNKLVIYRPPGNIISQSELVSLWEKKTGTPFKRVYLSESEMINLSESNFPISFTVRVFLFVMLNHRYY